MADGKSKRAQIISSFTAANYGDTGEDRSFTAGSVEMLPEAVFANYEHAGLVRAADTANAVKPAAKKRAARKPAAPKATAKAPADEVAAQAPAAG